ncbi:hypothetical protein ACIQWR_21740 [Streptomyces sp. NPDC098789]|uniref:hypothetical protein n=1 Tax=Streptomyces sp. NPDC098789 TaxID=3366098 RepID=UPI00381E10D0
MISVAISLIPATDGQLLIPAAQVTALLRTLAGDLLTPAGAEDAQGEPRTVDEAAGAMNQLADQLDVECIACTDDPGTGRRG